MRRRRLVAALLLCAAAAIAVEQLTPASPPTTTVLLAARDLPAGHVLSPSDLGQSAVSPAMVPDGSLLPESVLSPENGTTTAWTGRQLSGPVRRGEVLTDASLLGNELLVGAPPGSQAVPVRLSDPTTVTLLRQGQLVTVVLSSSAGLDGPVTNEVLASDVPVLWTPALAPQSGGLLPAQENEGIVVVAASPEQAVPLAGAINRGKVFLILLN
ncbi:flagellar biosynthesis protein FlgA [Arthrobacter glacialis]|uniref:Flagellar biosynthesis protein FlgA n=1 Tax=Arthrobacter glacialis TaxID=1664 RepID=A0A2S3ZYT4_ARTGL|nr:flagellar biosynthesis protein FlgA [Arthrobacter glacialis]POH74072.1 flagellar biosynthesis protein FlgA [Arthrobacter glacialis]